MSCLVWEVRFDRRARAAVLTVAPQEALLGVPLYEVCQGHVIVAQKHDHE